MGVLCASVAVGRCVAALPDDPRTTSQRIAASTTLLLQTRKPTHRGRRDNRAPAGGACDRLDGLFQQGQHALGQLVGLGHHRRAGLLQDLGARQVGGFRSEVRVLNTAARGGHVLGRRVQIGDRGLES